MILSSTTSLMSTFVFLNLVSYHRLVMLTMKTWIVTLAEPQTMQHLLWACGGKYAQPTTSPLTMVLQMRLAIAEYCVMIMDSLKRRIIDLVKTPCWYDLTNVC